MKMKAMDILGKLATALSILMLALGSGCALLIPAEDATPHEAGYETVEAYVVARPFIAEKHREIVGEIYMFAINTPDLNALSDEVLRDIVVSAFDHAEPAERDAVLVVFKKAKDRLLEQVELNPDMERVALVQEFIDGMKAAVEFYNLTPGGV